MGTACTEVEVDTLTGDWKMLRNDLVVDVGQPINPGIDVGQIEGAFLQGNKFVRVVFFYLLLLKVWDGQPLKNLHGEIVTIVG